MFLCSSCGYRSAVVRRSASGEPHCKDCFIDSFEIDVYNYIKKENLIEDGEKVCIGVSGGKDSSVLLHVLWSIRKRFKCDWNLCLLAIDEGIKGYRDHSLAVVDSIKVRYDLELKVLNFMDTFGYSMDKVVGLIGKKNNCTVCGTFRRQMLEVGAKIMRANVLCTGHNADDMAETVLLNIFRGDLYKLAKAMVNFGDNMENSVHYNNDDGDCSGNGDAESLAQRNGHGTYTNFDHSGDTKNVLHMEKKTKGSFRRIKPLLYTFEKEIVLYARFQSLDYFSTECIYSPESYRGYMRTFIKSLEFIEPKIILNIIKAGSMLYANYTPIDGSSIACTDCGIIGAKDLCKACSIVRKLDSLSKGRTECLGTREEDEMVTGNVHKSAVKALLSDKGIKLNYDH